MSQPLHGRYHASILSSAQLEIRCDGSAAVRLPETLEFRVPFDDGSTLAVELHIVGATPREFPAEEVQGWGRR